MEKLDLTDRIQVLTKNSAFITIKDHKPDFPNKVQCRLLNPSKSHVGRISKQYLEQINNTLREKLNYNQWRNTDSVIDWFKKINNKQQAAFIKFDIVSFYPSITLRLLRRSIAFAKSKGIVKKQVFDTILNARKSFLFHKDEPWTKKDTQSHFDVTEGSYDGAEVCELVGLYLLHKLQPLFPNNSSVGLYRDDGLAAVDNLSGPQQDRLRKDIIEVFKKEGLQITISVNLKSVDFLDVQFDLATNRYFPYRKPNDTPLYVHKSSNHPPNILKEIPKMTAKRLSNLSCNEEEFQKIAPEYEDVLKASGYDEKLSYIPPQPKRNKRSRKILWYNPPFELQVKTNVGQHFLNLVKKHFPQRHKLHKILNKNTVKVSYSCMPSISSYVSGHNIATLANFRKSDQRTPRTCNCENPERCPLNGECLTEASVYLGTISIPNGEQRKYIGISEPPFKGRWSDHMTSCNDKKYRTKTKLSQEFWTIKDSGHQVDRYQDVKFEILKKSVPYKAGSKKCNLCLSEKLLVMKNERSVINKRDEFVSKCRHTLKFMLSNFKSRKRSERAQID